MIWDGSEMYVIDSSVEIAAALAPGQQPEEPPQPVIFRLSDAVHEGMTDEVLEPPAGAASPASPPADTADQGNDDDLQGLLENIGELPVAQAATATAQLDVAIVADVQFVSASANPQAQIVAHMNVVDGIYSEQLGVHLNITELQLLNNNGPLTSSDAGTLLDQFRSFVSTNVANPGLAHLFTGRNMNSNVVGVAFLGVLCNAQFGIGLSQTVGVGTVGALIVAHEIGHNFGAPHDNQNGSTCASTGGNFLMNPSINGSDQFSPCSLDQIRPRLNAASCLSEITPDEPDQPDPPADTIDLTVTVPGSPISATVATPFTLTAVVSNGGTATAQNGTLTISLPGALEVLQIPDSCSTTPGAVSCTLPALVAGASSNIILSLQGAEPGNVTSTLTVAVANDTNPVNDTTQAATCWCTTLSAWP
jgi:hypothetical protein